MAICFWMITDGTGHNVLVHGGFDAFYDGQARSLTQGHWDVDPASILGEAFVLHGKYYGYFPFAPALPRIFLNWLIPSMYGRWTTLFMLFWTASVIAAIIAFMDELGISPSPFLLIVAVLGSTLLFLCSHAIVYHEAIAAGAATALWAYFFFYRYLKEPRLWYLAVACPLAFFSFFARFSVGVGPLLMASLLCAMLAVRGCTGGESKLDRLINWVHLSWTSNPIKHSLFLALCLALTVTAYAVENHGKFGTWLDPAPWKYHIQYNAARLKLSGGKTSQLSNVPYEAAAYFGPQQIRIIKQFPWFDLIGTRPGPDSRAQLDMVDGYSSIPAAMPALTILSILGLIFAIGRKPSYRIALPLAATALAAGCLILTFFAVSFRYVHDFYPFLIISALLGAGAVQSIVRRPLRMGIKTLIAVAGLWSIAACFGITLLWQRVEFWPNPQAQAAFFHMRDRVDSVLLKQK